MRGVVALVACLALSACAHPPISVAPAVPFGPTPAERLIAADAELRAGCLDCLTDAYTHYDALRSEPAVAQAARIGTIRAAGLIAIRELGLGMSDSGYLARARALVSGDDGLESTYALPLDTVAAKSPRVGTIVGSAAESIERARQFSQNRLRWTEWLRAEADRDPFLATAWVSLSCTTLATTTGNRREVILAAIPSYGEALVVQYELASCAAPEADALRRIAADDPRFHEVGYWLGFFEMREARLDEAQQTINGAYEWHRRWPAAASSLGGLAMTAEDFAGALTLYDEALALLPGMADALLGRVRALSYLGRAEDAIAAANQFLDTLPGDAYFWRAWNKNQLNEIEDAWSDVERAEAIRVTNEVAKLAGVIAYRRADLPVARDRFQTATKINPDDCESHFYLGGVQAELKAWSGSADAYLRASACLGAERTSLERQVATLEASNGQPARVARQIANRRQSLDVNDRRTRQSWFNLAAAYYNLQRFSDARPFAEKLVDDDQFGERARSLLTYLGRER